MPETTTEIQDTMGPLDKLMTADMARLMGDNQRVLDRVNRRAEAFAKWEAKQLGEAMASGTEDMQISIDSPTITHNHPPKIPPQQQSSGLGKALAGAAIAAGLIGIPGAGIAGFLLNQYMQKPQAPVVTPRPTEDNTVDLGLSHWSDLKRLPE